MSTDPNRLEAPIKAIIDATNAGNSNTFVGAFTKDGSVNDWGQVYAGRGEMGKWFRSTIAGTRTQLRVTGVSRIAGEIIVLLQITRGEDTESGSWTFRLKGPSVLSLEIG